MNLLDEYRKAAVRLNEYTDKIECRQRKLDLLDKEVRWKIREQDKLWGTEMDLSPHEMFGLVQEEVGEIAKSLNETFIPNQTDQKYAGLENIQEEVVQTIALLFRLQANLNTIYGKDDRQCLSIPKEKAQVVNLNSVNCAKNKDTK